MAMIQVRNLKLFDFVFFNQFKPKQRMQRLILYVASTFLKLYFNIQKYYR